MHDHEQPCEMSVELGGIYDLFFSLSLNAIWNFVLYFYFTLVSPSFYPSVFIMYHWLTKVLCHYYYYYSISALASSTSSDFRYFYPFLPPVSSFYSFVSR